MKRLKNIEDKKEEQLKIIRNIRDKTDIRSYINFLDKYLTLEAVAVILEIKSLEDKNDDDKLSFIGGNKKLYDFKNFKISEKLIKDLYNRDLTIAEAETKQNEFAVNLDKLRAYRARGSKYIDLKGRVFKNAKKIVTDGPKLFMGLKTEYYHFLKRII